MKYIDENKIKEILENRKKYNKEWLKWCEENKAKPFPALQALEEDKIILSSINKLKAEILWNKETVIEWLKKHINDYLVKGRDIDLIFEDLTKYMEE